MNAPATTRKEYAVAQLNAAIDAYERRCRRVGRSHLPRQVKVDLWASALDRFWQRYQEIVDMARERCRQCRGEGVIQEWVDISDLGQPDRQIPGYRRPCLACLGTGLLR